jgi:hypothetical protein
MKIYLDNNLGVSNVEQEELTQDTIGYNILKVYIPNAVLTPYNTFTCYYGALLQNGRKVGWFAMEARTSSDADYEANYTLYKATLEQCVVSVEGKVYIGCQVLLGNSGNATLIKKNTAVVQFNVRKSVAINNDILVLDTDQTTTDVLESYKNLLENALTTYATKANVYTKAQVDALLLAKADKSDTYTKTEVNGKLDLKADKSTAITHTGSQLQDYSGNNIYPNIDSNIYYNQTQIDDMVKTQAFYRNKTIINGVGWYVNYPYTFEKGCVYWLLYTGSDAQGRFRIVDENDAYHDDMQLSNGIMVRLVCSADGVSVRWNAGTLTIIRESDVEKDSIEYKYLTEKFNNLVDFLGDVQLIENTQFDVSVSEYWNTEFDLNIPKGCFIETALLDYSGDYFSRFSLQLKDTSNTWNTIQNITTIGQKCIFYADKAYTRVRFQIYRTTIEHNVTAKFMWVSTAKDGFIKDALNPKTYYLKKDGTGDFTSIVTAINTVCNEKNATLYIGDGTWDIVAELGSTFMESVTNKNRGLYLKNGVHIICSSKSLIVAKYTGTNANTREWFSAFNAGEGGFTLENATIESDNIRYTVHDERDEDADIYYNHYINCKMKHTNGFYVQCIGGGLGLDGHIIIDGCIFETDKTSSVALVSYHNCMDGGWTDAESKNAQSFVFIKNNYLGSKGFIQINKMGKSQKITNVIITNNSLGSAVSVVNSTNYYWYDNVDVKQWNNEVRS